MIDSPLFGLLFLGLIAAAPLVLRRMRAAAPQGLRVMGRTALHKGAVVAVVAVGERRLLLGAGERGVQLLAELDPASTDQLDPTIAGRTDASRHQNTTEPDGQEAALRALLDGPGAVTTNAGPGIGLVDRLRAMTVRTAPASPRNWGEVGGGRPFRVPLRR